MYLSALKKAWIGFIIIAILPQFVLAQITFSEIPDDLQLFPRDENNSAIIKINGAIETYNFDKIILEITEDNKKTNELSATFSDTRSFSFSFKIEAKPVEYGLIINIIDKNGEVIKVAERKGIVCGDFYVLYGQSNMNALAGVDQMENEIDTRLLRNFTFDNKHNLKWYEAIEPYGSVGVIGLKLQELILQKYGIPTCFINGSVGGASISLLMKPGNSDPESAYEKLYQRVKGAGALNHIKAILWRQGEDETCTWNKDIENYPENFRKLYDDLSTDYPDFIKLYNFQTGIIECNQLELAGLHRENMRQTKYLYDKIETTNSHGLPYSDGVHYTFEAYKQMAVELFPMIGRDIYFSKNINEIHPPDIQNVYLKESGDTLMLVFESDQNMIYPESFNDNGFLWQMKNYFYINSETYTNNLIIEKGWAEKNIIYLKLKEPIYGGTISYLPSFLTGRPHQIHLTNSHGLRAMSFYKVKIQNLNLIPTIVSGKVTDFGRVVLHFKEKDNYRLERKVYPEKDFMKIATVNNTDTFTDSLPQTLSVNPEYRLVKENLDGGLVYSPTLTIENPWKLNPNLIFDNEANLENFILYGENMDNTGAIKIAGTHVNIINRTDKEIIFNLNETPPLGKNSLIIQKSNGSFLEFKEALNVQKAPTVLGFSQNKIPEGKEEILLITGSSLSFIDSVFLANEGQKIYLSQTNALTDSTMRILLPDNLNPGTYHMEFHYGKQGSLSSIIEILNIPQITRVSPDEFLTGIQSLTIEGVFFGKEKGSIKIGDTELNINSWKEDEVKVSLHLNPGKYSIKLTTADGLDATYSGIIQVNAILGTELGSIIKIYPNPTINSKFFIETIEKLTAIKAINSLGKTFDLPFNRVNNHTYEVLTKNLIPGSYWIFPVSTHITKGMRIIKL